MFPKILFLMLAAILAILQATILPINFLLLLVTLVAFWKKSFSFWYAFLVGLLLDLVQANLLGSSSIKFLILALLTTFVKNQLNIRSKEGLKLSSHLT